MFARIGYRIIELSALDTQKTLSELLGVTSVLVGQSGMGKSTLVNFRP